MTIRQSSTPSVALAGKERHRWGEPERELHRTVRVCRKCGMVRVTRHDDPRAFPWLEWTDREGRRVYYPGTPPCPGPAGDTHSPA